MADDKTQNQDSELSVESIIADVMKKKAPATEAAKPVSGHDALGDDSYLSDYEIKGEGYASELKEALGDEDKSDDGELVAMIAAAFKNKKENADKALGADDFAGARIASKKSSGGDSAYNGSVQGAAKDSKTAAVVPAGAGAAAVKQRKISGKRATSVILCWFFGILFILLGIGISIFGYYTGLLNRDEVSYSGNGSISVNPVSDSDTMSEDELRKQLAAAQESFVSDDNVTNILIIGEDIRDTADSTTGNTDVMMLVSINDETEEVTLTSFMRDMYVEIADSGGTYAKLNSAYAAGGAELTMKTLKNNFGIDVDKYVLFNFYSFIDIVDACGGIDIRISDEEAEGMQSPMAEQNDCLGNAEGTDYLTEGGTYHMNGNQALAYARLRYVGNADFERTARQRRVVSKIAEGAKELSLVELSDLLDDVLRDLETNLTDGEIAYLLYNSSTLLDYEIKQLRIPADGMYTNETIRGQAVLVVDFMDSIKLFQETVYGYTTVSEMETESDEDDGYSYDDTDDYSDGYGSDYSYDSGYGSESSGNYNYFQ